MQSVPLWEGCGIPAEKSRRSPAKRSEIHRGPDAHGPRGRPSGSPDSTGDSMGRAGLGGEASAGSMAELAAETAGSLAALDWWHPSKGRRGRFLRRWRGFRPSRKRCRTSLNATGTEDISHGLTPPRRPFTVPGMQTPDQQFNSQASGAIAHLREREHALARFGWTGGRAARHSHGSSRKRRRSPTCAFAAKPPVAARTAPVAVASGSGRAGMGALGGHGV